MLKHTKETLGLLYSSSETGLVILKDFLDVLKFSQPVLQFTFLQRLDSEVADAVERIA